MRLRLLLVLLLLLAGCGKPVPPAPSDPNALVLRYTTIPSMLSSHAAVAVPEFSLYGGGRLLRPGKQVGGMMEIEEVKVDQRQADDLYRLAVKSDLDRDLDYHNPDVIDGGVVYLTLVAGDRRYQTKAGNPDASDSEVRALVRFGDAVRPDRWSGTVTRYEGSGKVMAVGSTLSGQDKPGEPWPSRPFSQGEKTDAGQCLILDDIDKARTLAGTSRWTSEGVVYTVLFRPMLPDENSCAGLNFLDR